MKHKLSFIQYIFVKCNHYAVEDISYVVMQCPYVQSDKGYMYNDEAKINLNRVHVVTGMTSKVYRSCLRYGVFCNHYVLNIKLSKEGNESVRNLHVAMKHWVKQNPTQLREKTVMFFMIQNFIL